MQSASRTLDHLIDGQLMEKQTKKRTFQPNRYCHNCRYGGQRASCRKYQLAIGPYDWCAGWKK